MARPDLEAVQRAPWMACVGEVARQVAAPGIRIMEPLEARWAGAGDAVEIERAGRGGSSCASPPAAGADGAARMTVSS